MAEDISSLGISVDSSEVTKGEQAIDSFVNAYARAEAASAAFTRATSAAGAAAARAAQGIGSGIQAAASGMSNAARVASNAVGSIAAATTNASRTAATAMGSISTNATNATGSITRMFNAFRSGAASIAQATSNLMNFGNAADSASASVTRLNVAANQNIGAVQAGRYHTANLAMQFQDIGVQAATMTSPLQIALQQGTQISAIFSGMGATGALKTFAGAIASVISPLSLLIIVLVGAAAAGAQMIDWIDLMKDGLNALANIMPKVAVAATIMGAALAVAFAPAIIGTVVSLIAAIAKLTVSMLGLAAAFAMANPFATFILGVGAAVTAMYLFRDEFIRILGQETFDNVVGWGNTVISVMVSTFETIVAVWDQFPALFENIFNRALNAAIGKVNEWINDIIDMYNDFVNNLNRLWAGSFPQIPTLPNVKPAFVEGSEAAKDLDTIIDEIWEKNNGRDWFGDIGGLIGRGAEWAAKKLRELADSLGMDKVDKKINKARDFIQDQLEDIEALRLEIELVGEGSIARDKANQIMKAEQKIRELGISLYGKEAIEIRKNARALAELTEVLAKKEFYDEQAFKRRQLGRSPSEQVIASELRAAGFKDDLNSVEAAYIRQTQEIERMKETWQSVFDVVNDGVDNFVDALFDGTKSFGDILKQLGKDIARLFFDLAITNPIKNWLTGADLNSIKDFGIFKSGASSGRGGGFGGILGQLFGAQKAIGSMQVAAGTVIVNGTITGLPGLANILNPLGPANNNTLPGGLPRSLGGAGPYQGTLDTEGFAIGGAGRAVDLARSLLGEAERSPLNINAFLSAGGIDINAAQTAWCAAFVNSALKQVGIKGTGSLVATDFLKWGQAVNPSNILKGDVLVQSRGLLAGQVGGHVGLATGATRMGQGGLELQMLSGNTSGAGLGTGGVGLDWIQASQLTARRAMGAGGNAASEALEAMTDVSKIASQSLQKVGLAGFEAVKGLTDAAGGLTQFGQLLASFASSGGMNTSWFQGLAGLFGGNVGALGHITSFGPQATRAVLSGSVGLFHSGGIAGYGHSRRTVDAAAFINAPRYHSGGIAGIAPDEIQAVLKRGEPVFTSWDQARKTFANDNANNQNDPTAIAKEMAKHMKLTPKIVNVLDPNVVGDYLRSDEGQDVLINELRRNKFGPGRV